MAKPKKTAPTKKLTKNKTIKKTVPKKVAGKKVSTKKPAPAKKAAGKKSGEKKPAKKTKTVKAPAKKPPARKVPKKSTKVPPKTKAGPSSAPKKAQSKEIKSVKKPVTKPEGKNTKKNAARPASKPTAKSAPKSAAKSPPAEKTAPKAPAEPKAVVKPGSSVAPAPAERAKRPVSRIKKIIRPAAFTLDEAREIAKAATKSNGESEAPPAGKTAPAPAAKPDINKLAKSIAPSHVKAASLADILGFNPKKAQKPRLFADPETIPEKYRRYYKLLLDLRNSLTEGLSLHTEDTLRRSTKDDAGDLSSYGQHMADAGTDTFDRDFALSMVASEQEALSEIDAAIKRIENGTYGICEVTQKPIAKERLLAVPFTRHSAEAQKEIERNRMRVRTAAGLFGELGNELGSSDDGGGDEE